MKKDTRQTKFSLLIKKMVFMIHKLSLNREKRGFLELENGLDGFGPHDSDDFPHICLEEGIIVLNLPFHAFNQCQRIDI